MPRISSAVATLLIAGASFAASAQAPSQSPAEFRAAHALDAAKKAGPGELYAFLKTMPKGADLHMHLSGAVYAETFIADGARQGLCVAPVDPGSPASPEGHNAVRFVPPQHAKPNNCAAGQATAASAFSNQKLYDNLIDSFSMRGFVPSQGINGHDQFFATFDRFGGLQDTYGEWLDEVASRAAAQNEQYLEVMATPSFSHAAQLGYKIGWPAGAESSIDNAQLAHLRDQLLADGLRDEAPTDIQQFKEALAKRDELEMCHADPPPPPNDSIGRGFGAACMVNIHFLYQVLRGFAPQQVYAQTLLAFEVATADPADVVGLNFVMPEDGYLSMRDYHLQMQMLDYLHSIYPKVHISLHAGELAPGMVAPAGLTFHIREAVEIGHAERIGHGIDILYEDNPQQLLKEMAAKHVMTEINLTSNDVILGIKGADHPLHAYMAAHVPVALSTDDEGVSRIDLTHEYVKAVEEQNLTYADLKRMARTSLEHAFLHGESLWAAPDDYARTKAGCPTVFYSRMRISNECTAFLKANEKAAAQFDLESRFAVFESAAK